MTKVVYLFLGFVQTHKQNTPRKLWPPIDRHYMSHKMLLCFHLDSDIYRLHNCCKFVYRRHHVQDTRFHLHIYRTGKNTTTHRLNKQYNFVCRKWFCRYTLFLICTGPLRNWCIQCTCYQFCNIQRNRTNKY